MSSQPLGDHPVAALHRELTNLLELFGLHGKDANRGGGGSAATRRRRHRLHDRPPGPRHGRG